MFIAARFWRSQKLETAEKSINNDGQVKRGMFLR